MADQTSEPTTHDPPGTPRWVKLLGAGALGFALVVVAVMVLSGGSHGPGMHAPGGDQESASPGAMAAVGAPAVATHTTRTIQVFTRDSMAYEPPAMPAGMRGRIIVS